MFVAESWEPSADASVRNFRSWCFADRRSFLYNLPQNPIPIIKAPILDRKARAAASYSKPVNPDRLLEL